MPPRPVLVPVPTGGTATHPAKRTPPSTRSSRACPVREGTSETRNMAICRRKATIPLSAPARRPSTLLHVAIRSLICASRFSPRLGHSLPGARSPAEASSRRWSKRSRLSRSPASSALSSRTWRWCSPSTSRHRRRFACRTRLAATMVGMRIPLDGVESLRQPVRLRRPYYGVADASETLRRLTTDSALAKALPNAADERDVMAVPVTCRDRVVAVLTVWGPGCTPGARPDPRGRGRHARRGMVRGGAAVESSVSTPSAHRHPTAGSEARSRRCSRAAGSSPRCSRSSGS